MSTPAHISPAKYKRSLRRNLRLKRLRLNSWQQQKAAFGLKRQLRQRRFKQINHLAIYLANDGEINPALLKQSKFKLYLPVIKKKSLCFVRYRPGQEMRKNRFAIAEPKRLQKLKTAAQLDAIALPLVGFDDQGRRLGMGGGFYDRALANLPRQRQRRPSLLGLAHSCQQVSACPQEPWDIPLDAVITEKGVLTFQQK